MCGRSGSNGGRRSASCSWLRSSASCSSPGDPTTPIGRRSRWLQPPTTSPTSPRLPPSPRPPHRANAAVVTTTTAPAATTTTVAAGADPGALPQTDERPTASGATFTAGVDGLWEAIRQDKPELAMPFFFPKSAYLQVKAISDPAGDYQNRLIANYEEDIHTLHAQLGANAATRELRRHLGARRPGRVRAAGRGVEQGVVLARLRHHDAVPGRRPDRIVPGDVDDLVARASGTSCTSAPSADAGDDDRDQFETNQSGSWLMPRPTSVATTAAIMIQRPRRSPRHQA